MRRHGGVTGMFFDWVWALIIAFILMIFMLIVVDRLIGVDNANLFVLGWPILAYLIVRKRRGSIAKQLGGGMPGGEKYLYQGGGLVGHFISWLAERAMGKLNSRAKQPLKPPPRNHATTQLPRWIEETCGKAIRLDDLREDVEQALKPPLFRLCADILLDEGYGQKRPRSLQKIEELLRMFVVGLLHDDKDRGRKRWEEAWLISTTAEITFPVPLHAMHANLPQAIDSVVNIFGQECPKEKNNPLPWLFQKCAHNLFWASGIDPYEAERSGRELDLRTVVRASEAKGKSPSELVRVYLKETPFIDFFNTPLPVALPLQSRLEHMHVVAGSGHGKTQLLQTLILSDLDRVRQGCRSVVVIDSQGQMFKKIQGLAAVGAMAERVIIIDPTDIDYPPSINLFDFGQDRFDRYDAYERQTLINGAIELYEYVFGALLGAELTQKQGVIFRYLARLLLKVPGATVHTLIDFMEDPEKTRPYLSGLEGHPFQHGYLCARSFAVETCLPF